MRKYVGTVTDNVVRMVNEKGVIIPHCKGGYNSDDKDLVFSAYETDNQKIKDCMNRNGLRFLTDEEVMHFFRGEDVNGNIIPEPRMWKPADDMVSLSVKEYSNENGSYWNIVNNKSGEVLETVYSNKHEADEIWCEWYCKLNNI